MGRIPGSCRGRGESGHGTARAYSGTGARELTLAQPRNAASLLRQKLLHLGLTRQAVDAAWPAWWSEEAEASASARVELRFSVARKLGLDPRSLLEDPSQPRFVWHDETRFKHLTAENELDKRALASFGHALSEILIRATPSNGRDVLPPSGELRASVLTHTPYVRLVDLLSICWAIGIPVIHLRVFPRPSKRMSAMSTHVGDRHAILLGKDASFPAMPAFYIGHELGHIALGHITPGQAVVDLDQETLSTDDSEEMEADRYSLELLTGVPAPIVLPGQPRYTAESLAASALDASRSISVEPGILALIFGYNTGRWATVNKAMRRIYDQPRPVWREINRSAWQQLSHDELSPEESDFLMAVLGLSTSK